MWTLLNDIFASIVSIHSNKRNEFPLGLKRLNTNPTVACDSGYRTTGEGTRRLRPFH